jgi:hypothetical protein
MENALRPPNPKEDGRFLVAQLATTFDLENKKMWRIEGIALTWATRQVVLWSNHKTAGYNRRLIVARTTQDDLPN